MAEREDFSGLGDDLFGPLERGGHPPNERWIRPLRDARPTPQSDMYAALRLPITPSASYEAFGADSDWGQRQERHSSFSPQPGFYKGEIIRNPDKFDLDTESDYSDSPLHRGEITRAGDLFLVMTTFVLVDGIDVPHMPDGWKQFLDWVSDRTFEELKFPREALIGEMNLPLEDAHNIQGRLFVAALQGAFREPLDLIGPIVQAFLRGKEQYPQDHGLVTSWFKEALHYGYKLFGTKWDEFHRTGEQYLEEEDL